MRLKSAKFLSALKVVVEQLGADVAAETTRQSATAGTPAKLHASQEYLQRVKSAVERHGLSMSAQTLARLVLSVEDGNFITSVRLLEQIGASEQIIVELLRVLYDTTAASDEYEMQFAAPQEDGLRATDEYLRTLGKGVLENPSVLDTINVLTGKHIYDTPVVREILSKAFVRTRTDSALIGDAVAVVPGKTFPETASATDAGSLRSQGYSDFSYFAEDYVGASRTF